MMRKLFSISAVLLSGASLTPTAVLARDVGAAEADPVQKEFANPPQSARPRVWWHWLNGNISKDGIRKDIEWMKRAGIGGMQAFDANLFTPTIVPKRLVFMHPEWKDAFRYAATLADQNDLELAIASSPGFSETGGPWVKPQDGLKKLVWSETAVKGGRRFRGVIAAPPKITGPYQDIAYIDPLDFGGGGKSSVSYHADVAVLAYPVTASPSQSPVAVTGTDGAALDAAALSDDSLTTTVDVARGEGDELTTLNLEYGKPRTIRSATLFVLGGKDTFTGVVVAPRLEASDDGGNWREVGAWDVGKVPTTISFDAVTARRFRVVFRPAAGKQVMLAEPAPGVDPGVMGAPAGRDSNKPKPIRVAELRLSEEGRIHEFERKAGFDIAPDYYALERRPTDQQGIDSRRVVNITERMQADGTLDWTPPKGTWRIVRLGYSLLGTTNHPATREATGLEVDKFDGAAVRAYLDHYLGMYRDATGPGLIGEHGVRALLTDSIEVGAANWTPRMVEQFQRLRGYDPTPWLPALTGAVVGSPEQSDKFLYDYRRTLADLLASEHYGTLATVAHENGLKVYGEALEDRRPMLGDDMAMRAHTDVPMAAMWTFNKGGNPRTTLIGDIKGAASVAHIYGQNLVAAESLTSMMSPWAHAPADLRRVIDLEFALGVNRPVIHTSVHQPLDDKVPGISFFIFGQYFNRHESWAEMAKPWVDYMARNSYLLQ
ncbi:MAG TPA: glycosyl hydrolase, partial [Sphingobium sp.]